MLLHENKAAQYVRMSTDMQKYSIENQSDAIAIYAARRGLTIVRSYEDVGRSGLQLAGRDALKSLLEDVQSGSADFTRILVYDVSRWGRFQDSDESAYYEFICKQAGVRVEYCAEQFENDGSLNATILKNIKRAMAGEFSRELSTKVFVGKCRIITQGFRVGSVSGFGLRRCLVDESGNRKALLESGQHKSIHTDRVILVPGPPDEVTTLKRVYDLFLEKRSSLNEIARILNTEGILSDRGCAWTSPTVRSLLSNEKYIGNNIFNRTSRRLGAKTRFNPPQNWVRSAGAFEPVVNPEQFLKAQRLLLDNRDRYDDWQMLNHLTAIWCSQGSLSKQLIDAAKDAPSGVTYRNRFGSLIAAFKRVGYVATTRRVINQSLREQVIEEMRREISMRGGMVRLLSRGIQLRINEQLTAMVCIARTRLGRPSSQWAFDHKARKKDDIVIVVRVNDASDIVKDYVVLPSMFTLSHQVSRISGRTYDRLEGFCLPNLVSFYNLCGRQPLEHRSGMQKRDSES